MARIVQLSHLGGAAFGPEASQRIVRGKTRDFTPADVSAILGLVERIGASPATGALLTAGKKAVEGVRDWRAEHDATKTTLTDPNAEAVRRAGVSSARLEQVAGGAARERLATEAQDDERRAAARRMLMAERDQQRAAGLDEAGMRPAESVEREPRRGAEAPEAPPTSAYPARRALDIAKPAGYRMDAVRANVYTPQEERDVLYLSRRLQETDSPAEIEEIRGELRAIQARAKERATGAQPETVANREAVGFAAEQARFDAARKAQQQEIQGDIDVAGLLDVEAQQREAAAARRADAAVAGAAQLDRQGATLASVLANRPGMGDEARGVEAFGPPARSGRRGEPAAGVSGTVGLLDTEGFPPSAEGRDELATLRDMRDRVAAGLARKGSASGKAKLAAMIRNLDARIGKLTGVPAVQPLKQGDAEADLPVTDGQDAQGRQPPESAGLPVTPAPKPDKASAGGPAEPPPPTAPDAAAGAAPVTTTTYTEPKDYDSLLTQSRKLRVAASGKSDFDPQDVQDRLAVLEDFRASEGRGVPISSLWDLATGDHVRRAEKSLLDELSAGLPKQIDLMQLAEQQRHGKAVEATAEGRRTDWRTAKEADRAAKAGERAAKGEQFGKELDHKGKILAESTRHHKAMEKAALIRARKPSGGGRDKSLTEMQKRQVLANAAAAATQTDLEKLKLADEAVKTNERVRPPAGAQPDPDLDPNGAARWNKDKAAYDDAQKKAAEKKAERDDFALKVRAGRERVAAHWRGEDPDAPQAVPVAPAAAAAAPAPTKKPTSVDEDANFLLGK